jgi:NAD(P) transhydrogenase
MKYNLIVIGSGPAGQKAAISAAKMGKSVAIIDRKAMLGGVSLHGGTVPSKTLREAILHLSGLRQRAFYGKDYTVKERVLQEDLKARVKIVEDREMLVIRDQLQRNNVDMYFGMAQFLSANTISVDIDNDENQVLEGENILIACGTRPAHDPGMSFDGQKIIDVDQILDLKEIPRELIVVGAGIIGLEYASMFAALDVKVTILERRETILDFIDREIMEQLIIQLQKLNVIVCLGETVKDIAIDDQGVVVTNLISGKVVKGNTLLYAVGRKTNVDTLNLDAIGLETDERGRVVVNETLQTKVPSVYAAGDVIGFPALAATSMEQGRLASRYMFANSTKRASKLLPYGIYTIPEISMIGQTEQELTELDVPYEIGVARFDELARGGILGLSMGYLKLLFNPESFEVLGVHIIGESATELIHIGQAVMSLKGTVKYFRDTVFNYPTLAEAYKVAALDGLNKL